jgi:ABC-type multidrug transport system fused ATPase/permease subunit
MTATTIVPPTYVTESEELYSKGVNPQTAKRLVAYTRPYLGKLILSAFLMLIASAASVAGPYFVKIAIDSGLDGSNVVILRYTILAFLTVSVVQWVCTYFRVKTMAWVGQSIIYDLRKSCRSDFIAATRSDESSPGPSTMWRLCGTS